MNRTNNLKIIVFLLLISVFNTGAGQNLTKQWNIAVYDDDFSPEHTEPTWSTHILKTGSDTLIEEVNYTKLFWADKEDLSDIRYFGALRGEKGKMFINKPILGDLLLYDFSLEKGDTVTINRLLGDFTPLLPIFTTIDSIVDTTINNRDLKKIMVTYELHSDFEKDIWMDGIGSLNYGLLNESCMGLTGCYLTNYLLCYSENDEVLIHNPNFETCFKETVLSIADMEKNKPSYTIYPNPLVEGKRVKIESEHLISDIKIYSLNGLVVYSYQPNSKVVDINLESLKNGFYIICVDGLSKKLIVAW